MPGGKKENGHRDQREGPREGHGEQSGGEGALFGAGIFAVVAQVHDAIDGHGGGAGGDHGDYHPCQLTQRRPTVMGGARAEQRSSQRERQGKHGVLEFNHFEHDFDAVGAFRTGRDAGC